MPRWFGSLAETQQILETWRSEYHESRPHRALGRGRPTSSPLKEQLAAISSGCKQQETHPKSSYKKAGPISPIK